MKHVHKNIRFILSTLRVPFDIYDTVIVTSVTKAVFTFTSFECYFFTDRRDPGYNDNVCIIVSTTVSRGSTFPAVFDISKRLIFL